MWATTQVFFVPIVFAALSYQYVSSAEHRPAPFCNRQKQALIIYEYAGLYGEISLHLILLHYKTVINDSVVNLFFACYCYAIITLN